MCLSVVHRTNEVCKLFVICLSSFSHFFASSLSSINLFPSCHLCISCFPAVCQLFACCFVSSNFLYISTGSWLTACPDRYSYFHRIVPLLLTSIMDDVTEVVIYRVCTVNLHALLPLLSLLLTSIMDDVTDRVSRFCFKKVSLRSETYQNRNSFASFCFSFAKPHKKVSFRFISLRKFRFIPLKKRFASKVSL